MNLAKTILIFVMIFLLFAGCTAQTLYIRSLSQKMLTFSEQISLHLLQEDWAAAHTALEQLRILWQDALPTLTSLLDHDYTNPVSSELHALEYDLAAENFQQLPAEAAHLYEALLNLARAEFFTLSNIF